MTTRTQLFHFNLIQSFGWVVFIGVMISACGSRSPSGLNEDDPSTTICGSKVAQIDVLDGFMQIRCGCTGSNETPGTLFQYPNSLTCQLPSQDSVVFFSFFVTNIQHQIIPAGEETFNSTPIVNPKNGPRVLIYGVSFPKASTTYSFQDAFTGMKGTITVP